MCEPATISISVISAAFFAAIGVSAVVGAWRVGAAASHVVDAQAAQGEARARLTVSKALQREAKAGLPRAVARRVDAGDSIAIVMGHDILDRRRRCGKQRPRDNDSGSERSETDTSDGEGEEKTGAEKKKKEPKGAPAGTDSGRGTL